MRRHGQFEACEDVVQEALLEAAVRWPEQGVPDNPRAWLLTVASRRLTDQWRSEQARRRREVTVAALEPPTAAAEPTPDADPDADDTLTLLFLCCHPALPEPSQLALTLRAVGGLTTAEIARAFLVPEPTMAQRISRAKQRIRAAGATFAMPPAEQLADRLRVVLQVLYLIFNEGYTASSGPAAAPGRADRGGDPADPRRASAAARRRRGGRAAGADAAHRRPPGRPQLPTAAWSRSPSRTAAGGIGPRSPRGSNWSAPRWRPRPPVRTSCRRPSPRCTSRRPGPRTPTGRRSSSCTGCWPGSTRARWCCSTRRWRWRWWTGPRAGLELLDTLGTDERLAEHHRLAAVRAHLLEQAGEPDAAREQYLLAARRTTSLPEQRYLQGREARLRRP